MVKNFKNILLQNQEADDLETWYTATGTPVLPMFSYDDPELTLTIFMTGSDLFLNASAWVKAYTALAVLMYFQICSNSVYPQHAGEQYRTNVPLVYILTEAY